MPAGDELLAVNRTGDVFRWDDGDGDWGKIFQARGENQMPFGFSSRLVGPVYDPAGERIVAFKYGMPGFSPLQASNRLLIGTRADDWRRSEGVNVPDGATALFLGMHGELLAASAQGIHRLEGDLTAKQQDINVFGLHIPLPEKGGRFVNIGSPARMRPLESAAIDPASGMLALFDGYQLALFEPSAQRRIS